MIAGGLDWAYDMSGFLRDKQLADPRGNGVIYANHAYPFKGDTVERWIAKMEAATRTIPVIVSEFGSDPTGGAGRTGEQWVRQVLQALDDHDWNWTAWDLHPAASPCLISDWKYTPTPTFGKWVKQSSAGTAPAACNFVLGDFVACAELRAERENRCHAAGHLREPSRRGHVLHPGSAAYDAASRSYTVTGSGENMWFASGCVSFRLEASLGRPGGDGGRCVPGRRDRPASQGLPDDPPEPGCRLGLCRCRPARRRPDVAAVSRFARMRPRTRCRRTSRPPGGCGSRSGGNMSLVCGSAGSSRVFRRGRANRVHRTVLRRHRRLCSYKDVTEKAVFSNVELTRSTPRPPAGSFCTALWKRRRSHRRTGGSFT